MARYSMRLPDLGEGTVSAEVIAWRAKVGDLITEDAPLVEMATDKAVVEVPSPVTGRIVSVTGSPGESIAVGAELAVFETESVITPTSSVESEASMPVVVADAAPKVTAVVDRVPRPVRASPATRRRAFEAGIDLARVRGSGPGGRILSRDLVVPAAGPASSEYEEIPVIGIRRVIAQRMAEAKRHAPHFAYVEEVDVTELEWLRQRLNAEHRTDWSYLPFIARALVKVLRQFPQCNAHYDADRNVIKRYGAVHLGIATQTPDGLKVPVVRDAGRGDLRGLAAEIRRVTEAAREGRASRSDLGGSTITLTSLGKLGGIVSTPILNLPEVAIVGINKATERVVVRDGKIAIRRMMNLSSSFDHRFVDGYDAAAMIQALKIQLEQPETIFAE
ncbi:MAG: dihydrolipoamide acetyltransferase family protein [Steroidobacteraceae bacterium]|jgi:2-oxoisovalerate dehydrogenase E2 component (dihydrolipoyl transacylase)